MAVDLRKEDSIFRANLREGEARSTRRSDRYSGPKTVVERRSVEGPDLEWKPYAVFQAPRSAEIFVNAAACDCSKYEFRVRPGISQVQT